MTKHDGARVGGGSDRAIRTLQLTTLYVLLTLAVLDPMSRVFGPMSKVTVVSVFSIASGVIAARQRLARPRQEFELRAIAMFAVTVGLLLPSFAFFVFLLSHDMGDYVKGTPVAVFAYLGVLSLGCACTGRERQLQDGIVWLGTLLGVVTLVILLISIKQGRAPAEFGSIHSGFAFGHRQLLGISMPYVRSPSTAALVVAIAYWTVRGKQRRWNPRAIAGVAVTTLALAASGTIANIVVAAIAVLVFTYLQSRTASLIVGAFVVVGVALSIPSIAHSIPLSRSDISPAQAVDARILTAYGQALSSIPDLAFGSGLGSCIPTPPAYQCVAVTRFGILDLVRIFGVPGTAAYVCLLGIPLFSTARTVRWKRNAYAVSLLLCATGGGLLTATTGAVAADAALSAYRRPQLPPLPTERRR